ncbi:MAG: hypothetical protein ACK5SX_01955, partial [Sandaracinobacter sp.]
MPDSSNKSRFLTAGLSAGIAAIVATTIPALAQAPQAVPSAAPQQAAPIAPSTVQAQPPRGAPVSFADLTARLQPAVVNISTTQR